MVPRHCHLMLQSSCCSPRTSPLAARPSRCSTHGTALIHGPSPPPPHGAILMVQLSHMSPRRRHLMLQASCCTPRTTLLAVRFTHGAASIVSINDDFHCVAHMTQPSCNNLQAMPLAAGTSCCSPCSTIPRKPCRLCRQRSNPRLMSLVERYMPVTPLVRLWPDALPSSSERTRRTFRTEVHRVHELAPKSIHTLLVALAAVSPPLLELLVGQVLVSRSDTLLIDYSSRDAWSWQRHGKTVGGKAKRGRS